jgi:F-type H+-transporting ATPase subunit b
VIRLDITLIVQMVNFLILLWILNRFIFQPVLKMLEERRGRIQESESAVKDLEGRAAEQWESYQRQLQEVRIEANREKEGIKGEGLDAERKLLEEARADASRRLEEAREDIEKETAKARDFLRTQAEGMAMEMAAKILGRSLQ